MEVTPTSVINPAAFGPVHAEQFAPICLRQLAADGLPPVPVDPSGRHMSWVLALDSGTIHYGGELREWDLAELVEAFHRYTANGYEPPVLAEHDPSITRGERLGDLVDLREHDGGLIALVRWSIPHAAEAIESGSIRYMSPGIGRIEMHDTGDVLETIFEISVVTSPHQRGAATHVLAKEQRMDAETGPTIDDLRATIEGLQARLDALEAPDEDMPEEDIEEEMEAQPVAASVESDQVALLRAELAEVKRDRDWANFCAEVQLGSTVTVTESGREALFALYQSNADAFNALAVTAKPAEVAKVEPVKARIQWGARFGSSDVTEPTAPTTAAELNAACLAEAGGDKTKAAALYVERAPKMGIL